MKLASAFDDTIQILRLEWTFLTFGFLMSFWSAFGQTFFISLFSPQLRNDLNLSHGELGTYYALATLLSAFLLYWCGKLTDKVNIGISVRDYRGCLLCCNFFFCSE